MSTPIKPGQIREGDRIRISYEYVALLGVDGDGTGRAPHAGVEYELVSRPAKLPTAWGTYSDKVGDIWTLDDDGLTRICDAERNAERNAKNYAPFERMFSGDEMLTRLANIRNDIAESGSCTTTNIERARRNVAYLIDTLTN